MREDKGGDESRPGRHECPAPPVHRGGVMLAALAETNAPNYMTGIEDPNGFAIEAFEVSQ
jgi:hypothetical protein